MHCDAQLPPRIFNWRSSAASSFAVVRAGKDFYWFRVRRGRPMSENTNLKALGGLGVAQWVGDAELLKGA